MQFDPQPSDNPHPPSSIPPIYLNARLLSVIIWINLPSRRPLAYYWGAAAAVILILVGLNSWINPVLRLRLSSEGDNEWYNAGFIVPEHINIEAGEILPVTVTVTNEGALHWSSQAENPINLGGRWYRVSDDARSDTEMRWTLDKDIAPGESLRLTVPLVAPVKEGAYQFEWDLVQEDVIWFSQKNGIHESSMVTVLPVSDGRTIDRESDDFNSVRPSDHPIPNRQFLCSTASKHLLDRRLLGIGLDNFRITFGKFLGLKFWNDSIHTNNWYVETIVSLGILGSLPFFGWLILLGLDAIQRVRNGRINLWQIALIGSIFAFLIHGLLDYFLLFNGTGLLFWILVGMWIMFAWSKRSA
jgi:hypothetical protein